MHVLFIHRQGPGQFAHLARSVAAEGPGRAVMIAGAVPDHPPCRTIAAPPSRRPRRETHPYLIATEQAVLNGQATARAVLALLREGFRPDVVLVHPGWGDALFLPEVLPRTPLVVYAEYFPRSEGTEIGHDEDLALDEEGRCALVMRQAPLLLALEAATAAISPTRWQRDLHPPVYRQRIAVIHEGIDTAVVKPDPAARLRLADGTILSPSDEVVSYVARDLEPVRGFPALMRALTHLLAARPEAHVVICGGDGVSYGRRPPGGGSWRERLASEIGPLPPRVHFTGPLPYAAYLALLQITRLHLHPSAPFVLSWSVTEAMAAGAVILGADTAPLREVIRDGFNGFLADPRDHVAYAARAATLLAAHDTLWPVRRAARRTIALHFGREAALSRQRAALARAAGLA